MPSLRDSIKTCRKNVEFYIRTRVRAISYLPRFSLSNLRANVHDIQADIERLNLKATETETKLLFSAVGQALSAWATMEEKIVYVFAILLPTSGQKAGVVLYSIINFNVWLSVIGELFELDSTQIKHKNKWNKISARIRKIKDRRDQLAHHKVNLLDKSNNIAISTIQPSSLDARKKTREMSQLDLIDICDLTDLINKITEDIIILTDAMKQELLSSQDKSS